MKDTNTSSAPWYIIDASDRKWAELQVLETMVSNIEVAMQNQKHSVPILQNVFPLVKMPKLTRCIWMARQWRRRGISEKN